MVVAQANTVWRQSVATINTAQINEANMNEVLAANNLSMQGLNELWQQERDLMAMSFDAGNNTLERVNNIAVAEIRKSGEVSASSGGSVLSRLAGNVFEKIVGNIILG